MDRLRSRLVRSPRSLASLAGLAIAAGLTVLPHIASAQDAPLKPPSPDIPWAGIEGANHVDTWADEAVWDVPGQFVIDARDDLAESDILSLAGAYGLSFTPTDLEEETRIEIATIGSAALARILPELLKDGRIEHVEPLARVRAFFTPDDPQYKEQWHMDRVGAPRAWDFATGRGVTVAVVDTGIACETHGPFNKGTDLDRTDCVGGWNFVANNTHANDDQGHGSHVAGTIAQSTNNGRGVTGLAFHASLMPVKVLNEDGWGTTADVADGIRWAADHGAHVINLSLGGPRNSKILEDAVKHALSKGSIVVAAAGNSGGSVGYPGATEGVIGVSASDPDDKLAKFSSRGNGVDIAAPGVNVTQQTVCKKGRDKCEIYPAYNGTSMASPHVAGAAALVVSLGVTDPAAVEGALKSSARVVDSSENGKKLFGAGILQAADAVGHITFMHALVRLLFVALFSGLVGFWAFRKNRSALSVTSPGYVVGALLAGPGLLFFLPWILPRAYLPVDLLARPIGDMDLLFSATLHRWLPLANAAIPFALTALAFGSRSLRPLVAGISVGMAAYLASVALLGEHASPFGQVLLFAWCGLNVLACGWLARENLAESKA
ncbi:MAG: S8 family peptidase [Polyangiaceae bacterium]